MNTRSLQITPELLNLIAEIDEFKGAWRSLETLAPDRLSALRRVATIESIGSSTRIEGSRLSDRDVERLLPPLNIQKLANRDEAEVVGYAEVMELIFGIGKRFPSRKTSSVNSTGTCSRSTKKAHGIEAITRHPRIAWRPSARKERPLRLCLRPRPRSTRRASWRS